MPRTINPIRKARLKQELLKGKSYRQALKDAGYSAVTAHCHIGRLPALKSVKEEIRQELEDKDLVNKAYNTLNNCLKAKKDSDRIAAAQALLKFKVGDISNIKNANPDKIVIAYNKTINNNGENSRIPQSVVEEEKKEKSSSLSS